MNFLNKISIGKGFLDESLYFYLDRVRMNRSAIERVFFVFILFTLVSACHGVTDSKEQQSDEESNNRLKAKAKEALAYCKTNKMNTDFCILIDMKIHSGKNRMFAWNFKTNSADRAALCAHGVGKEEQKSTPLKALFSNVDGSWLSSIGKYKLGIRSYSKWGIRVHYKMHGLEKTNSNA